MPHIFVSHATADDALVTKLHDALEAATKRNLWVDHKDILTGEEWQSKIETALRETEAMLVVISKTSAVSMEVIAEWRDALVRKVPILPAIIDDIPYLDIPSRLRQIQYVNLHTDWDKGIEAIIGAITRGDALPEGDGVAFRKWPITSQRPLDRRLTGIPISGRESDLEKIRRELENGPTAILGVGGLGKSRMAAEVALTLDGISGAVWHTVSEFSSADEVLELLRDHLGLANTAARKETLARVRQNPLLVVLDNAEDVLPNDPRRTPYVQLADDLTAVGAKVLLTSRVEWDDVQLCYNHTPGTLPAEAARQVALDMAEAFNIKTDLSSKAGELAEAAKFHPRLIEWAVKKLTKFPVDIVITELRDLKSREVGKALDEMILKTLNQMSRQEGIGAGAALKQLNVFRGGFTYAAARAVVDGETDDLNGWLNVLQTWQFVSFNEGRYSIDPLVVSAVGEDETGYEAHREFYKALANQHNKKQDYLGLDPESANLEVAFERAMGAGKYEDAYWLANACYNFLLNRGRVRQFAAWMQRAAEMLANNSDETVKANAQNSLGTAYSDLAGVEEREANLRRAIEAYQAALAHYTPAVAPLDYAMTQNNLGTAYSDLAGVEEREANLRRAIEAYQAALVYRTPSVAPLDYAATKNNLGAAYSDLAGVEEREANLRRAIEAYQAALVYRTPSVAPLDYAGTQIGLGNAYRALSQLEELEENLRRAMAAYEAALAYYMPSVAPLNYARSQHGIGNIHWDLQNFAGAIASYREAERYYRQMGDIQWADKMLSWIADGEAQLAGDEADES